MSTMIDEELRIHKQAHNKQNSWWLKDIRGIEVSRVCSVCVDSVKGQYDPAIFGEGERYEDVVEDRIEPEDL